MIALSAIGATTFAAIAWGSVTLVLGVFGYEMYAVLCESRKS